MSISAAIGCSGEHGKGARGCATGRRGHHAHPTGMHDQK
jgi:hypothetical protein